MFEAGLFTFLATAGTTAGNRVYPRKLPQGVTLPAMTYFKVSPGIEYTHSGESGQRTPRYQLDCWGADYMEARSLANEVITAISGYSGMMGDETVMAAFIEGDRDEDDPASGRSQASLDVIIQHVRR
jgi:hypothetical protein